MLWLTGALGALLTAVGAAEQTADIQGRITFPERWTSVKGGGEGEDILRTVRDQTLLRVLLNDGRRFVVPDADGSFIIPNVPIGVYLLDVQHPTCTFESVVVEVQKRQESSQNGKHSGGDMMKVSSHLYAIDKLKGAKLKYPLSLTPWIELTYFQREDGFQIMSILKNPLAMMMAVSFAVMGILPLIQSNMDPEELRAAVSGGDDGEPAYQSEFLLALQSETSSCSAR